MTNLRTSLFCVATIAAGGISTSALAETSASTTLSSSATDTPDSSSTLHEIVVTAQKRSEKLEDVPGAVTVLDAQNLVAGGELSINDYFRSVPGLTLYDNGNGFKELVIRGITAGNGQTPTVGIYIDETPIGSSTGSTFGDVMVPDLDPSDLQRIEVLKGPQSTLYGASNVGGLLKYVTVQPDPTEFSGHVGLSGDSVDHGGTGYGARGSVNIPLVSDTLALRISASTREDPGYIENVSNGAKNVNETFVSDGRLALLWNASEAATVNLSALVQTRRSDGLGRIDYNFITNEPIEGDLKQNQAPGTDHDREQLEVYNATIKANLAWATLTASTSFSKNRYSGGQDLSSLFSPLLAPIFGIPDFGIGFVQSYGIDKFTQEVRLDGHFGHDVDWLAGVFYTHEKSSLFQQFNPIHTGTGQYIPDLPLITMSSGNSKYEEISAYTDVTYHFTPRFDVQAGVRFSYNDQTSLFGTNAIDFFGGSSVGYGTYYQAVPTYLFTPEFKFTENQMVYGRIASGYRAGGPNYTISGQESSFKSDYTVNYEVGFKSDFLQHKAYVDIAAFYVDWSRIQLLGVNALDEEVVTNAGKALSPGVEVSAQYIPVNGLTLGGNLTYANPHLTQPAPEGGGIYAPSGTTLPYSAKLTCQISARYEFPISTEWRAILGGDFSHVGSRYSDFLSNEPPPSRILLPAYNVFNLQFGMHSGIYTIDAFVKNVSNERAFLSASSLSLSDSPSTYDVSVMQPRTVGVSLGIAF